MIFNSATDLSAEEIIEKFQNSGEQVGVCGKFRFRESPEDGSYFEFPVMLKKIFGDKIIALAR